jgi:nitronate monooxygenase
VASTGRCLVNEFTRRWQGKEIQLLQNIDAVATGYAAAAASGNFDVAAVIAGDAVSLINDIPPAAEIIDRLVTEANQILLGERNSSSLSQE